jgi:hypothetical protein
MHYGREARNGDKVVLVPSYGAPVIGICTTPRPATGCNGKIAPIAPNDPCPNLKECLHLEDVLAAVAADPRAAPPSES